MKQILHILHKDIRHLWPRIAILWALISAFAFLDIRYSPLDDVNTVLPIDALGMVEILLPVACWFLIASAVHEESLPGETQFWLTRPYSRGGLLAAKALFCACTISVPFLLADCYILAAQDLPVLPNFGGLILRQLITAIWLILPPFAIAAITKNFSQYILAWFIAALYAVLVIYVKWRSDDLILMMQGISPNVLWLLCAAAAFVMLFAVGQQYAYRSTGANRTILAGALLIPMTPIPWIMKMAIRRAGTSSAAVHDVSLAVDRKRDLMRLTGPAGSPFSCFDVPVAVIGLPARSHLRMIGGNVKVQSSRRIVWESGWHAVESLAFRTSADGTLVRVCADNRALTSRSPGEPVSLIASSEFAVIATSSTTRVPATSQPFQVAGVGTCQIVPYKEFLTLLCKSAVRPPVQGTVNVEGKSQQRLTGFISGWEPLNLLPGFSPVYKWTTLAGTSDIIGALDHDGAILFTREMTIALIERDLIVSKVRF